MLELNLASSSSGEQDNSKAFKTALLEIKASGGGTLRVSEGVWRTGPLELFSNTTLILDKGAVVSFIPEPERYTPVRTRWEGVECYGMHPCLFASGQSNICIEGGGIFDGSGQVWWDALNQKRLQGQNKPQTPQELALAYLNAGFENQPGGGGGREIQFLRPPLIQFFNCENIILRGITLQNSPFWTLHPVFCSNIIITGVSINNPHDAPNTDGIDIDSCEDVLIEKSHVSVGDDGIAIKSGSGEDGIRAGKPSKSINIQGCTVEDGHGGIVIGSETAAGVYDILAEDCIFNGTDRGIRIKTRRGRGGRIENLEFKNLKMENNLCPLAINMFYRCGADSTDSFFNQEALPVNDTTPSIKNITINNIQANGCRASAGFIAGLPESPVENLTIQHCEFSTDESSSLSPDESDMFFGIPSIQEKSFRLLNVKNTVFNEVYVKGPKEAFIYR